MEHLKFGKYLEDTKQIQFALENLDVDAIKAITFEERFKNFEANLKIEAGDGLPITALEIDGPIIRARVNEFGWNEAQNISEIGVNPNSSQGRAHANGYQIFYGANRKKTAVCEVLQDKGSGLFEVTLGVWEGPSQRIVNFVDGADDIFKKIPFVHSMHKNYLKEWPTIQRQSATLLIDYFKDKFKQTNCEGLYNTTNVLAGFCFSLQEIDGIGYASISDDFEGYNIALRNFKTLQCVEVEKWKILKIGKKILTSNVIIKGKVVAKGDIEWNYTPPARTTV